MPPISSTKRCDASYRMRFLLILGLFAGVQFIQLVHHNTKFVDVSKMATFSDDPTTNTATKTNVASQKVESPWANETAIAIRTRYPFSQQALTKILGFAKELYDANSQYDLILLVDTTATTATTNNGTTSSSVSSSSSPSLALKKQSSSISNRIHIFEVNESSLLGEFPKFHSFLFNTPEPNIDNQPGWCCGISLMWQSLVPTFAMMYHHYNNNNNDNDNYQTKKILQQVQQQAEQPDHQYKYIWCVEDDIDTVGELTLFQLIQQWDLQLEQQKQILQQSLNNHQREITNIKMRREFDFDLVALSLRGIGRIQKGSSKRKHTQSFHQIIQQLKAKSIRPFTTATTTSTPSDVNSNNDTNHPPLFLLEPTTPWTSFSDAIQRHSQRYSRRLYEQIANNTFAWAETFVHPIAWEGGFSVVDLRLLPLPATIDNNGSKNEAGEQQQQQQEQQQQTVEVYHIDQHSERKEVLEYYNKNKPVKADSIASASDNSTTPTPTATTATAVQNKTVIYHAPTFANDRVLVE